MVSVAEETAAIEFPASVVCGPAMEPGLDCSGRYSGKRVARYNTDDPKPVVHRRPCCSLWTHELIGVVGAEAISNIVAEGFLPIVLAKMTPHGEDDCIERTLQFRSCIRACGVSV